MFAQGFLSLDTGAEEVTQHVYMSNFPPSHWLKCLALAQQGPSVGRRAFSLSNPGTVPKEPSAIIVWGKRSRGVEGGFAGKGLYRFSRHDFEGRLMSREVLAVFGSRSAVSSNSRV